MKIYIFVDDERESWFNKIKNDASNIDIFCHCKNYKTAIQKINLYNSNKNNIILDLDHDLGGKKSGYDIAKYIVENQIPLYGFYCHSFNPVGKRNIEDLLLHYSYKKII